LSLIRECAEKARSEKSISPSTNGAASQLAPASCALARTPPRFMRSMPRTTQMVVFCNYLLLLLLLFLDLDDLL